MLWVPTKGKLLVEHNLGGTGTTTPGTSVTTGAAASTKGTAVELIASTAFDAYLVKVSASNYGLAATASQGSLDLLIGTATEEVLVADMLMGYCGSIVANGNGSKTWWFPLYIPAGSRLAARVAGARTSTAMRVWITLYGGQGYPPFDVGGKVTTYGMGTVPDGTSITPGASGAEGSWTQITSSTSENHFAFVPSFQPTGDTTINLRNIYVDLGVGAATEEPIGEGFIYSSDAGEQQSGPNGVDLPVFQAVPSGTRLVMRASNSGANDGGYNGVIHAVS